MKQLIGVLKDLGTEVEDALERFNENEDSYLTYVRKFPDNENIVRLREAIRKEDYELAKREVHTLKGIADNLGFLPIVDATMEMLLAFRKGDNARAVSFMPELEQVFETYRAAIES